MDHEVVVYWTCSHSAKKKIQERFGFSEHVGLNGESYVRVRESDFELFQETMQRGFFKIRHKEPKNSI